MINYALIILQSYRDIYSLFFYFSAPLTYVSSVSGMLTNLPCNITPSLPEDKVNLVLWYKDQEGKPLFRYNITWIYINPQTADFSLMLILISLINYGFKSVMKYCMYDYLVGNDISRNAFRKCCIFSI